MGAKAQMQAISTTHHDFSLRLKRIEASSIARTQRVFVGEDESYILPRHVWKVRRSGLGALIGNAAYPISMVIAVLLGITAHAMGMILRFYLQGLTDWKASPDIEMLKQLVLGYALAMVFGYLLGLRSSVLTPLKSLGVATGVLFFHNAVHLYPQVFAKLTSALWVAQMIDHTKVHSVLWRGISFIL